MPDLLELLLILVAGLTLLLCALILVRGLIEERHQAQSRPASRGTSSAAPSPSSLEPPSPRTVPPLATSPALTASRKPVVPPDSHLGVTMDDVDAYLRGDPEQDSFKKGQINAMMEDLDRWQRERHQPKEQGKH